MKSLKEYLKDYTINLYQKTTAVFKFIFKFVNGSFKKRNSNVGKQKLAKALEMIENMKVTDKRGHFRS